MGRRREAQSRNDNKTILVQLFHGTKPIPEEVLRQISVNIFRWTRQML